MVPEDNLIGSICGQGHAQKIQENDMAICVAVETGDPENVQRCCEDVFLRV